MKILAEHYTHMAAAIAPVIARVDPASYRAQIVAEGKSKNPDKRVRWDYLYAAKLSSWICDNLYSYMDDAHIDTALRAIMAEHGVKAA